MSQACMSLFTACPLLPAILSDAEMPWNGQVLNQLVVTYVASHPNSPAVLPRLWRLSPPLVLTAMVNLYNTDSTTISRCLDICQVGIQL